jgi:acetyl esterase/lipase
VVSRGYFGLAFSGHDGTHCNDGVIRPLQPDVAHFLETMKALNLPTVNTMSVSDARAFALTMASKRPSGPNVAEVADGSLPGAAGDLTYRLYRPASPGPHGIVVYFHGGGWVLGSHASDEPFCRDLCVQSGAIVVSVDYRHAPENRFPSAVDDGFAAVQWIAANAAALGADGRLAVCGWSAGGNIAAVACQMARDAGGPSIRGQVLVTPVTDCDLTRESCAANAEGYGLTTAAMRWFWDHYADPADRAHPKASPLRAADLSNLPPAMIVTCEFDPLRDEGDAYAQALAAAGGRVQHLQCRGQIHMSVSAFGLIASAAGARTEIAAALREFLQAATGQGAGR